MEATAQSRPTSKQTGLSLDFGSFPLPLNPDHTEQDAWDSASYQVQCCRPVDTWPQLETYSVIAPGGEAAIVI